MPLRNRLNQFLAPFSRKARNRVRTARALERQRREQEMINENRRFIEQQERERQLRERERMERLAEQGRRYSEEMEQRERARREEWQREHEEREREVAEERIRQVEEQRRRYNLNVPSESIAFEIHNKSKKFMTKIDELNEILKRDLQIFDTSKYDDIYTYLENTIGSYIDTSPTFASLPEIRHKFNKIMKKVKDFESVEKVKDEEHVMMGLVTDFVFTHNLQDNFIEAYIEECAGAYKTGNGLSCPRGIIERFTMILPGLLTDKSGGVFDELKSYFGITLNVNKPWNFMSSEQQSIVRQSLNETIANWMENYKADPSKYLNGKFRRDKTYNYVVKRYKNKTGKNMSDSIKNLVEREYVPKNLNKFNEGYNYLYIKGGNKRITHKKIKKSKKTMRRRKH
jgi:hypothetical protein